MANWTNCADGSAPSLIPSQCPACSDGASAHDEILVLGTAMKERKEERLAIICFIGFKLARNIYFYYFGK